MEAKQLKRAVKLTQFMEENGIALAMQVLHGVKISNQKLTALKIIKAYEARKKVTK